MNLPAASLRPAPGVDWRTLVYRCFVEYNPLYFASALCILAGVFLLAAELPKEAFESKVGIIASTEAYQILLIAGAAVLLRAGLRRPAAILGLTALVFLLDVALNGERLLSHVGVLSLAPGMRARRAVPLSVMLALLGPVKLWLLAFVFRLRAARGSLVVASLALFLMPLLPYLTELVAPGRREMVYLMMSWLGAPLLGWALSPAARSWTSGRLDEPNEPRFRNIVRVAPLLVAGLFMTHGLLWSFIATLSLSFAQLAPFLLLLACRASLRVATWSSRKAEFLAWAGAGATLWAAAHSECSTGLWPLALMALATGGALITLVEFQGLRLFLPAAVSLFGGAYMLAAGPAAPLPTPGPIWPAGLAVALLAGALRQRDFRCLFVSSLAAGAAVSSFQPVAALLGYGGMVAGLWLAASSWLFFPELRRVPFAATAVVLAIGTAMVGFDVPGIDVGYGACAAGTLGIGLLLRRFEFQSAGVVSGLILGAFKHGWWVPGSSIGWGILLLSAGFVLLSAGVAVNLLLARGRSRVVADARSMPVDGP